MPWKLFYAYTTYSFILLRNIHEHFLWLQLVLVSTFQKTVGSHLKVMLHVTIFNDNLKKNRYV